MMFYKELMECYKGGINPNMYGIWFDVSRLCWVKKNGAIIEEYKIRDYIDRKFDYLSYKTGFFDIEDVFEWFIELMTRVELKVVKMRVNDE